MLGRVYRKIDLVTGIAARRHSGVIEHHVHVPCCRTLMTKIAIGCGRRADMGRRLAVGTGEGSSVASIATHRRHGRVRKR